MPGSAPLDGRGPLFRFRFRRLVAAPTRGLAGLSVESQEGAPDSTLALYRNAIGLRAKHLR